MTALPRKFQFPKTCHPGQGALRRRSGIQGELASCLSLDPGSVPGVTGNRDCAGGVFREMTPHRETLS